MTTTATTRRTRRDMLKGTLALAGLGLVALPEWVLPALAQGDTIVPFLDFPDRVITNPAVDRRIIDIRAINGPITPKDEFFTTQHYGHGFASSLRAFAMKYPANARWSASKASGSS